MTKIKNKHNKQIIEIDNLEECVELINRRDELKLNWEQVADKAGTSKRTLQRRMDEAGYYYSKKDRKYLKDVISALDEVAVSEENNDNGSIEIEDKNKGEEKMENNNSENEMNIEIDDIVDSVFDKKEYKAFTAYLRSDIHEALNSFAKDTSNKKAKQELINGLLELALKRKGYL